jgi:hypothetical protein
MAVTTLPLPSLRNLRTPSYGDSAFNSLPDTGPLRLPALRLPPSLARSRISAGYACDALEEDLVAQRAADRLGLADAVEQHLVGVRFEEVGEVGEAMADGLKRRDAIRLASEMSACWPRASPAPSPPTRHAPDSG